MDTELHKTKRRQDITFEEKDQALRDDVRTLGAMVGDLIREQNGEELFELVENARLRRKKCTASAAGATTCATWPFTSPAASRIR